MSTNDIKVLRGGGENRLYKVNDRATGTGASTAIGMTIKPGEPIVSTPTYAAFAYRIETAAPKVGTDVLLGIASKESTETSSADGTVEYITIIPNQTVLEGKASTVANVDTAAELLTYLGKYILFDASNNKYSSSASDITIDEDDTDDPNVNGLKLIDGSADADGLCRVIVNVNATEGGSLVGQTMD